MMEEKHHVDVLVIGLVVAKSVFQFHGVDEAGAILLQKRLMRARLCCPSGSYRLLIGIEDCAIVLLGSRAHEARPRGQAHASPLR